MNTIRTFQEIKTMKMATDKQWSEVGTMGKDAVAQYQGASWVKMKVASFGGLVTGKAGVVHRLVGGFAVVNLREAPAAGRGVCS